MVAPARDSIDAPTLGGVDNPTQARYRCAVCRHVRVLDYWRDFTRGPQPPGESVLADAVRVQFDQARALGEEECQLDFTCEGCGAPVRIIYEPWEFRMSLWAYTMRETVGFRGAAPAIVSPVVVAEPSPQRRTWRTGAVVLAAIAVVGWLLRHATG